MSRKIDKRTLETQKSICDAYVELLKTKEPKEIKVTQICDYLQMNRSTFYLHFNSSTDIFEKVLNDTIETISNRLTIPQNATLQEVMNIQEIVANEVSKDETLAFLMYQGMQSVDFIQKFANTLAEKLFSFYRPHTNLSDQQLMDLMRMHMCCSILMNRLWTEECNLNELKSRNQDLITYMLKPSVDIILSYRNS